MSSFLAHHATSHGNAPSPARRHSSTSLASLVHHNRDTTLVDDPAPPAAEDGEEDLSGERRTHRADLVEERPEGDLPEEAFRQVPAAAPGVARLKEAATKEDGSLSVPGSKPPLGSRSSSVQRLQAAARKISAARILLNEDDWDNTRTPGVDPLRVDMPGLKANVVIQAVDCCHATAEFNVLDSTTLVDFLAKERPAWSKVRWIHANGLSWDVIKPIALKYDLHPLALEDMLHQSSNRSKLDYYKNHAFCNIVSHRTLAVTAADSDDEENENAPFFPSSTKGKQAPRSSNGHHFGFHTTHRSADEESIVETSDGRNSPSPGYGSGATTPAAPGSYAEYLRSLKKAFKKVRAPEEAEKRTLSHSSRGLTNRLRSKKGSKRFRKNLNERMAARWTVAELTKDIKVHIHVEQVAIFVLRNGTILTFTQDPGYHPTFSSIFDRISSAEDIIRESEDSSMILQALLDVVGDAMLEIIDEFREQLTTLESHVLSRPSMSDVRHLHILSSQLLMLKSTFTPFQFLLQALRTQDDAKAAAAAKPSPEANGKRLGFVSHEAKVYLGDVIDHVDSVLSSLDLFGDLAENLIAYTFNNLSYSSNSYMQALSVLSVIFLPLTFLSGYFGMNFETFPHVLDGGVSYFWKIAIPTAVATILVFGYEYVITVFQSARRLALRMYHRSLVERQNKEE
ncbi:hypothetical protein BCR35DRAFT_355708 [Leucosporidium creatinivorum]|uniref:Cora-domain-containing protein n=1 Tax=Leucosporidium creatinivorum TaxID=106004 RepID=A0A1Y2D951_9BASI|nr:hypothetical protein BCR35DRAFT_355708 [Leucosporidium creatinivorum]